MRFVRQRGSLSNIVEIFIPDVTSAIGAGKTGLSSASTNLVIAYKREKDSAFTLYTGANIEAVSVIGTFANPSTSSKVKIGEVSSVNYPGLYQIFFHNNSTIFGSGDTSQSVIINVYEVTTTALNIGPCGSLIPLVPYNPQDGVRMGMTALPNAIPGANGGLPTTDGTKQVQPVDLIDAPNTTAIAAFKTALEAVGGDLDIIYGIVNSGSYGLNALLTAIINVQNGTFISTTIPQMMELPVAGSVSVPIIICFADEMGAAKNLDSGNPTILLFNDAGDSLASRLSGIWTNPATGKYVTHYTKSYNDASEGINWDVTGTINGKLRRYPAYTQIVNMIAVDFTAADRAKLELISGTYGAKVDARDASGLAVQNREEMDSNSTKLAHLDADISKGLDAAGVRSAVGLTSANLETVLDIISSQILTDANIVSDCETAIVNSALTIDSIQSGLATQQGVNNALALMEEKIPSTVDIIDAIHDLPDPWAKELPGSYPAGSAGKILGSYLPGTGSGSVNYIYTLRDADTGIPIPGADIRVSTDIAGADIIASSVTNTYGQVTFLLDPGTYYFWRQKTGWTFSPDPDVEIVTV